MRSAKLLAVFSGLSTLVLAGMALSTPLAASAAGSVVPPISAHGFYGWGVTSVANASAAGAPAKPVVTVTVSAASGSPWSTGAAEGLIKPVTQGEHLTATFYIRALSPATGQVNFSFEQAAAPYTNSIRQTVSFGKAWKKVVIPFSVVGSFPAAQVHVVIQTGFQKEKFQIAGLVVK